MRKHNSPVNNRSGMNLQNSSKQDSQGNEGKKKNERKGSVNTNPSHEVPNSFPGFRILNLLGRNLVLKKKISNRLTLKISRNLLKLGFLNKKILNIIQNLLNRGRNQGKANIVEILKNLKRKENMKIRMILPIRAIIVLIILILIQKVLMLKGMKMWNRRQKTSIRRMNMKM